MIAGTMTFEDMSVNFHFNHSNGGKVTVTLCDNPSGLEMTKEVDATQFAAALALAIHPNGDYGDGSGEDPTTTELYRLAEQFQNEFPKELRLIP